MESQLGKRHFSIPILLVSPVEKRDYKKVGRNNSKGDCWVYVLYQLKDNWRIYIYNGKKGEVRKSKAKQRKLKAKAKVRQNNNPINRLLRNYYEHVSMEPIEATSRFR